MEPFPGDDESAQEAKAVGIKNLCAQGAAFAGACSNQAADHRCPIYVRIRASALAAIDEQEQGFYRDFSAFYAIEMCIAANDLVVARELYCSLTADYFRWRAEHDHPWLSIIH